MAAYRVLDIETIPDPAAFTANAQRWSLAPGPPLTETMDESGYFHRGRQDGPTTFQAGVVPDEQFPPPQGHRVVAVSWVELGNAENEWYFATGFESECAFGGDAEADEERLLRKFSEAQQGDNATLVSWNGRVFDLPVLNLRSFRKGIAWPWYYFERDLRYRYSEAGHCDMMDVLSDYGACRGLKLGDAAKLIGLPGKTGPVSGATVAAQIAACQTAVDRAKTAQEIAVYCLSDSIQTAILFIRHRFHRGIINAREHNNAIDSFKGFGFVGWDDFDWSRLRIGG